MRAAHTDTTAENAVSAFPLTLMQCRDTTRRKLASRIAAICDGLLDKAERGDSAAVRTLLHLATLSSSENSDLNETTSLSKQAKFIQDTLAEMERKRDG